MGSSKVDLTEELTLSAAAQVVATRRDLHRFAELGFCEFRTASKVVRTLEKLGLGVRYGRDVMAADSRMGVPPEGVFSSEWERAVAQGADPALKVELADGLTGVVGSLSGDRPGPVIAVRFDMDANSVDEAQDADHLPAKEGFVSVNPGVHHNCGHDGHTAIGLTLARLLAAQRDRFEGEVRLIFQPAEEGVRGAQAMVDAGVLEGVEALVSCHIGVQARSTGTIIAGYERLLESLKFDAHFSGRNAHAGISPEKGRNALLAAAVATQNLLAISRHGGGETRVNVGLLRGGEARNSVPANAVLKGEVRGEGDGVGAYLVRRAQQVVAGAAAMHEVDVAVDHVGRSSGADSSVQLRGRVEALAASIPGVETVVPTADYKASDDVAIMMRAVQATGGEAVYVGVGADLADAHHTPRFDFDEACLDVGVRVLHAVVLDTLGASP